MDIQIKKATENFTLQTMELPMIIGNPVKLEQAFINLIKNACQALTDRQQGITIATRPDNDKQAICVVIIDQGRGILSKDLEFIRTPFFKTNEHTGGKGLGFSVAAAIIKQHKGTAFVNSRKGAGTTFTLMLPAARNARAFDTGPPEAENRPNRHGTVLIADDEPAVHKVAAAMMAKAGYDVLSVFDGKSAVVEVRNRGEKIDCVLMDLTMPEMDGIEACAQINAVNSEIPVILMSGFDEQNVDENAGGNIITGFIHKPFRMKELLEAVADAVPGAEGE